MILTPNRVLCGCCRGLTEIYASLLDVSAPGEIRADAGLIREIYAQVRDSIRRDRNQKAYCVRSAACRKKTDQGVAVTRFMWVGIGKEIGQVPDQLLGPFCTQCWNAYKHTFQNDETTFAPPQLPTYTVKLTNQSLTAILAAPQPSTPKPTKSEPTPDLEAPVEDLF